MERPNDLLTVEEAAQICRATVSTFRHWLYTGRLASVKLGRKRLVRRDALSKWIESNASAR